jgi:thiosulfate dehydrogenase [quinone] large subunit
MSWPLRILRAFLGGTFVFAGAQKFLDPNFLRQGSPDFVGTQLRGFATGTPAGPLLRLLGHAPVVTGVAIALTEIAVGLAVLAGVFMVLAAVMGFLINLTLFLSATWHVHPFFLGSDSAYCVMWLAFGIGVWELAARRSRGRLPSLAALADGLDRRTFLRAGLIGGATLGVALAARSLAGPIARDTGLTAAGVTGPGPQHLGAPAPSPSSPSASPPTTPTAAPPAGRTLTTLDRLPVGRAVGFDAPGVGPAVLVRLADDQVVAYSRVCTHAGCLVGYDANNQVLFCPCHGAEYDPAQHAEVLAGPTSTPLRSIPIEVDPASGAVILPT